MARRRPTGRFPALRQGQRRESIWIGVTETVTTLAAANTAALILTLNATALALRPFTVVRTRLDWVIRSDQTGALESYQVALGAAVVSDQSVAIGVTAVPTPFTDLASDLWFVHEIVFGTFLFVSGAGFAQPASSERTIDSRAMRKVEDGQDIVFVLENSGISDGSFNKMAGRMLVKLH